jgi:IS5 family transposase
MSGWSFEEGDVLERLNATVDFELFRPEPEKSALRADGTKGSRPAFDHVLMFKACLSALHPLHLEWV